jgi:hypothetical protein
VPLSQVQTSQTHELPELQVEFAWHGHWVPPQLSEQVPSWHAAAVMQEALALPHESVHDAVVLHANPPHSAGLVNPQLSVHADGFWQTLHTRHVPSA